MSITKIIGNVLMAIIGLVVGCLVIGVILSLILSMFFGVSTPLIVACIIIGGFFGVVIMLGLSKQHDEEREIKEYQLKQAREAKNEK